jgi:hypothetical protein
MLAYLVIVKVLQGIFTSLIARVSDPTNTVEIFVRIGLANNEAAQFTSFDLANYCQQLFTRAAWRDGFYEQGVRITRREEMNPSYEHVRLAHRTHS